jgi:uncharacterized protein
MEMLEFRFNVASSNSFFEAMESLNNVFFIERIFEIRLIEVDEDDNKFVDCAYASNVNYLVTNDKHFNKIKQITFPKLNVISIEEFIIMLK